MAESESAESADGAGSPAAGGLTPKLSIAEYEAQRDRTTREQLTKLISSREYRGWVRRSTRPLATWKLEAAFALLGVCLGAFVVAYPFWGGGLDAAAPTELATGAALEADAAPNGVQSAGAAAAQRAMAARLEAQEATLRRQEAELRQQLERNAQMELSLWAAEHELHELQTLTSARPSLQEMLLPEGHVAGRPAARPASVLAALWELPVALVSGAVVLLAIAVGLCTLVVVRRRAAAARANAQRLQKEVDAALEAQAAAEARAAEIAAASAQRASELQAAAVAQQQAEARAATSEAAMLQRAGELRAAAVAQQQAEAQVTDLQQCVLELQKSLQMAQHEPPMPPPSSSLMGGDEISDLQADVKELKVALAEREEELLATDRELSELADRLPREVQEREAELSQARRWLDQAQGQLQHTQEELNLKEHECKQLEDRLAAQRAALEEAADKREAALEAARAHAAVELRERTKCIMDIMKQTRLSLSQKLINSQNTCEALAREVAFYESAARGEATPREDDARTRDVLRDSRDSSASFEGFAVRGADSPKIKPPPAARRSGGGENLEPPAARRDGGDDNVKPPAARRDGGGENAKPPVARSGGGNAEPPPRRASSGRSQQPVNFGADSSQRARSPYWFARDK